ncbi:MAG: hypothetical protein AAF639_35075, partial [Chloroflexota bacterium]
VERQLLQDTELTQQVVALEEPESHVLVFEKLSPDAQVLMLRVTDPPNTDLLNTEYSPTEYWHTT